MHPGLGKRLISAAIIVMAVVFAAFYATPLVVLFVLLAISTVALLEYYSFLKAAEMPHFTLFGLVSAWALLVATWVGYTWPSRLSAGDAELLVILLMTTGVMLRTFSQKNNQQQIATIAGTVFGVLYTAFLLNFLMKLLLAWPSSQGRDGRWLIMYMLLVVKWSDSGAYFVGCSFGKHKLFPRLSPNKTWEGLLGGLGTGLLVSMLCYVIAEAVSKGAPMNLGVVRLGFLDAIFLGLLISVVGVFGDLTESLLKRAAGVKDSSKVIRGMGGVLDVVDSILFAAPFTYYYAKLFL